LHQGIRSDGGLSSSNNLVSPASLPSKVFSESILADLHASNIHQDGLLIRYLLPGAAPRLTLQLLRNVLRHDTVY
jgi:hypothetical protein